MSQKTNRDLLDFGQDIKRMSADNITPPDTASKPHHEETISKPASESKTPTRTTPSSSSNVEPDSARSEQMRRQDDKSDGRK
ncbi:hypothetical protein TWF281_006108 [Arthrobotrys megalospora]